MRMFLIFILCLSTPAAAEALSKKQRAAINSLQMDYATCLSYYNVLKSCAPKAKEAEAAKEYDPIVDRLTEKSFGAGKTIGMTSNAMVARITAAGDEQMKFMQNSCDNLASLSTRHGGQCKKVVENPDAVLQEYLDKSR